MGRDAGLIALYSGLGAGAEGILIPETKNDLELILEKLSRSRSDKKSKIIVVSEGDEAGGAFAVSEKIKESFPDADVRVSILGHIQRGGSPSCMERVNSGRMGFAAVDALLQGRSHEMIGIVKGAISYTPFVNAVKLQPEPDADLLRMGKILSS
jgi:6-phosphofructokinase 1